MNSRKVEAWPLLSNIMIGDIFCHECVAIEMAKGGCGSVVPYALWGKLQDDQVLTGICKNGHSVVTFIAIPKFLFLFDIRVMSYLDGYYRESILNFATSIERMYEYYIHIVCDERNINKESFLKTWGQISSRSERELGAFSIVYLLEMKKPAKKFDDKLTNLRNDIAHKGKFPSESDALKYYLKSAEYMIYLINEINQKYSESASMLMHHEIIAREADCKKKRSVKTMPYTGGSSILPNLGKAVEVEEYSECLYKSKLEWFKSNRYLFSDSHAENNEPKIIRSQFVPPKQA